MSWETWEPMSRSMSQWIYSLVVFECFVGSSVSAENARSRRQCSLAASRRAIKRSARKYPPGRSVPPMSFAACSARRSPSTIGCFSAEKPGGASSRAAAVRGCTIDGWEDTSVAVRGERVTVIIASLQDHGWPYRLSRRRSFQGSWRPSSVRPCMWRPYRLHHTPPHSLRPSVEIPISRPLSRDGHHGPPGVTPGLEAASAGDALLTKSGAS